MDCYCTICGRKEKCIPLTEANLCRTCYLSVAEDAMEFARRNTYRGTTYHAVYAQLCRMFVKYADILAEDALES